MKLKHLLFLIPFCLNASEFTNSFKNPTLSYTNLIMVNAPFESGNCYLINSNRFYEKAPFTLSKLHHTISTNWTLTSRTVSENSNLSGDRLTVATTLAYYPTTYHYTGTITSNVSVVITFEGKETECVLKSINIGTANKDVVK